MTTNVKLSYGRPQKQFKIIHLYFSMLYDAEHGRINLALCGDIVPSRHAGVDVFATHGPHILMGIEIYHGKPIFYSLGNLIMQNDTLRHVPAYPFDRFGLDPRSTPSEFFDHRTANGTKGHPASPEFWQSMAVLCRFEKRQLKDIKIYPVDMGFGRARAQRGRPVLGDAELGKILLDRVARLSEAYGTRVELHDGRGIIRGT